MIKEDYISFEIAKLLKEKWFKFIEDDRDELSQAYIHAYTKEGKEVWGCYDSDYCPCITLNVAMKWLREVHQIYISINCCYDNSVYYTFDIFRIKNKQYEYIGGTGPEEETDDWNDDWPVDYTYEKACENAIKYCLTNLI